MTFLRNDRADVETTQINAAVRGIDNVRVLFSPDATAAQLHFARGLPNLSAHALHLVLLRHHSRPGGQADPEQCQEGRGVAGGELLGRPPPQRRRLRVGHPPQDVVDDEAVRRQAVPQRLQRRRRSRRREGGEGRASPCGGGGGGGPCCAYGGSTR